MDYVIGGADMSFGLPFLWQSVRTSEAKHNPMSGEKIAKSGSEEFPTIVTLDTLDVNTELSEHVLIKAFESGWGVRLVAQRETPREVSEIIHDKQIIFEARKTCYW